MEFMNFINLNIKWFLIFCFSIFTILGCDKNVIENAKIGFVFQGKSAKSSILKKEISYSVYLPPDYYISDRTYPMLILLHGSGNDENSWIEYGKIDQLMDEAISSNVMPGTIVVMPNGENTWYCNVKSENYYWEDAFIKEFILMIEKTWRCGGTKQRRIIGGVSMGGFGALKLSMTYSNVFQACVAFSPAIFTDDEIVDMDEDMFGDRFKMMFLNFDGEDRLKSQWKDENPLYLIDKLDITSINSVKYYIDCGDEDYLYRGNALLHVLLMEKGISHEFRMGNGKHTWPYWREALQLSFTYISQYYTY